MLIDPVVGERFFGRNDVLALLEKRVDALKSGYRQNIAITGHRLTGKSSVLNHFLSTFKSHEILPIYIEVLEEPFRQFATKFIGIFLYNYLKYNDKEARDDLDYLIQECEKEIPVTVSHIKNILKLIQSNNNESAYSELLNLSSVLKEESNRRCIVMLDEFHNLSCLGIKDPFKGFGKKIMTQKDTMYIVASSEVSSIQKILSEKLALLFGNFEKITLGGFDCETSRAFLQKKLSGVKLNEELLDFIIAFADGHPFYLDVLSSKIQELLGKTGMKALTMSTVVKALQELLFDSRGTINQFFTNLLQDLLEAKTEKYIDTLTALAHGLYKQRELSEWSGCNKKEISKHLNTFIEKNLIYSSGNVYRFYDKALRFWLKDVYHKRRTTLVDNISDKSKVFRGDVEAMIQRFLDESRLDVIERIKTLFESFNNEIVNINSKRRRLMHFDRTEITDNGERRYIVGYLKEKVYLVHIAQRKIGENDILEFIKCGMQYKPHLQRHIILPLQDMEINAKIIAKELRMWIFDFDTVNELLDMFGKQMIVRINRLPQAAEEAL